MTSTMNDSSTHGLVTGGAGYIGSHVAKALAAHGMVPVTYDSLVHGHRSAVRWGPFIHGDEALFAERHCYHQALMYVILSMNELTYAA